jgi:hypothetical protein
MCFSKTEIISLYPFSYSQGYTSLTLFPSSLIFNKSLPIIIKYKMLLYYNK